MATVPCDGVTVGDEMLFNMYKELLKHLRSKMDPNMLRALERVKDGGVCTPNLGGCKLRVESLLASIVAGEDLVAGGVPKAHECVLKAKLQSLFGHVLINDVISAIVGMFVSRVANMPHLQQDYENLIVDLLKLLVESSCFKMNDYQFFTPPLNRKADGICESHVLPLIGKHQSKKPNCMQQARNVDAKVLFPEVFKDPEDVVFVKEVNLKDNLNEACNNTDAMYNEDILHGKKVVQDYFTKDKKLRSPCLSFVSEDGQKSDAAQASKFHVTPLEKRYYNAVCSLASSIHARSVIVDIGGCILKHFALGDSMAPRKQVCSFVVNCMCRKFFLDERPTVSRKHYFFSSIYLLFPVLYDKHCFLFVVDLKNKMFTFLDSYYSKGDYFCVRTRNKLKHSFRHAWAMFVGRDPGFNNFRTSYARVPKQDNQVDCGVFMIKFMEVWKVGCNMLEVFSQDDIPNIRVQIVNDLLFSKHNTADVNIVKNLNANGAVQ